MDKKFPITKKGYDIEYVNLYIEKLEDQLQNKDAQITKLKEENDMLKQKIRDMESVTQDIEKQKLELAELIIEARKEAKSIVDNAVSNLEKKKQQLVKEIEELETVKREKIKELEGIVQQINGIIEEHEYISEDVLENAGTTDEDIW